MMKAITPYQRLCMVKVWLILIRAGEVGLLLNDLSAAMGKGCEAPGSLRRLVAEMSARGFIVVERDPALPRSPTRLWANFWRLSPAERAQAVDLLRRKAA